MNYFAIDDRIYYPREKCAGVVTYANEAGDVGIICLDDGRRFALAASQVEPEPDPDALPCGHDRGPLHSDGKGEWWYEDEGER